MDMRARETSSQQNHRPVPAYLEVSALEKRTQTTPDRTRFSNEINVRSGVAARTPFLLRRVKLPLRCLDLSHLHRGTEDTGQSGDSGDRVIGKPARLRLVCRPPRKSFSAGREFRKR